MKNYRDFSQCFQSLNKHFLMVKEWIHNVMIIIKKVDSNLKEILLTYHQKKNKAIINHRNHLKKTKE